MPSLTYHFLLDESTNNNSKQSKSSSSSMISSEASRTSFSSSSASPPRGLPQTSPTTVQQKIRSPPVAFRPPTSPPSHRTTGWWLHSEGIVNGIRLHWVEAGRREDPLILLLHGFPEFWYSWRQQIPALVTAGYRVAAPDLRGYNLSEKPAVGYDLNTLSQDIYELACLLTERKVVVAGHDWGGAIAWAVAQRFPDKIEKLVISNAPPLGCLAGCSWSQWLRLYYVAWFQVPCLPELFLGWSRGWLLMRQLLQAPCFDDGDKTIEIYRDAISQPGALRCMLNYYRQIRTSVMQSQQHHGKVQCPVQVLWGIHDTYLTSEWLNSIPEVCDGPLEMVQLECGHWTQQEVPDQVTRHMLLFLGSSSKSNFSK